MTYIDTHTHIYLEQFDADRAEVVGRALNRGVKQLIMPNVDCNTIDAMMKASSDFPNVCLPMMGLHPTSVNMEFEKELEWVEEWLAKERFVAIGETGIDLYWDKTWLEEQKRSLHRHAELALTYDLPLVLHARKSLNEIFEVLASFKGNGLKGVFHCFPGSVQDAERVVDMGFLMGIGGVVTYNNSSMSKVVEAFGLEHFVLETDSPYLSPVPYRGKRNESAYIPDIALKIAHIKGISLEQVAGVTTENARKLFLKTVELLSC